MNEESGLLAVLDAVRRRWKLLLVVALPLVVGSAYVAETLPPTYTGETTISFAPRPESDVGADIVRLLLPRYAVFAASRQNVRDVADALALDEREVADAVDVSIPADTGNLTVTVELDSPDLAAEVANALAAATVAFAESDPLISGIVVESALPPSEPSGPPRRLIELASLLAALLLGIGLAVIVERFAPTVRSADDVAQYSGLPVIGRLPATPWAGRHPKQALADPLVGASVRTLRTQLARAARTDSLRVIMFTSALSGEGKTTVSVLFSSAAAALESKVILIDGDMLRPNVARRLSAPPSPGLAELLRGQIPALRDAVRTGLVPGLTVLTTRSDPEAGDLVVRGFEDVLIQAREDYDLVVIDAPPLMGNDVSRTLATLADGVVLVVAGGTPVSDVRETVAAMRSLDIPLLGVVANRLGTRSEYARYGYAEG